jgi:hypothetical protein
MLRLVMPDIVQFLRNQAFSRKTVFIPENKYLGSLSLTKRDSVVFLRKHIVFCKTVFGQESNIYTWLNWQWQIVFSLQRNMHYFEKLYSSAEENIWT